MTGSGEDAMIDTFASYETGLRRLLEQMRTSDRHYAEVLTLQARLLENITHVQQFGDDEVRRASRAEIVNALNRLALEVAGASLLDLGREEISPALSTSRPSRLFPFLSSFETDDADIFFGRDREIKTLVGHIEQDPVVVVIGLSGCGKSSLIKAGVIPLLRKSGYQIIYTPVFENVIEDVLHEIKRVSGTQEMPQDYIDALQELYQRQPRRDIVLIVDQFEQAFSVSHDRQAKEEFVKGIPRLVSQARRFATIVIVLRADWLYYLERSVHDLYPGLNVYSCTLTLDPLAKEAAWEAITRPLQARSIPYDEDVVEEIVDCLHRSYVGPSMGPDVQPIQLQMVLRALFDLAEDRGVPQQGFTRENYQASGGVESILRNYLAKTLGRTPEAWRLLARFIAQDGKTGRTIRRSELQSVPAAEDVESELKPLVSQGFVEAYEAEDIGEVFYRLAHDYLVDAIVDHITRNPEQKGWEWKLAEDWLAGGTLEWRESTRRGDGGDGLLLEKNRYLHIYEYRDRLKLTDEARRLLIFTALHYGHEGLGYWLSRGAEEADLRVVADKLLLAQPEVQRAARNAVAGCVRLSREEVTALGEKEKLSLREKLWHATGSSSRPIERDAAAQALWVLQSFQTSGERFQVGRIVFHCWMRDHWLQITSYLFTALFVLTLAFGAVYIREKLRGSWELIHTLKAGMTPLVVADPDSPEAVYVLTIGGPGPREGSSLFVRHGDEWELRSRDFSKAWPTSLIVVHGNTDEPGLYATMYGAGVMRSQDGGQTWELVNRGLPSHGLSSLVADPDDPQTIYVATNDWRGVLRSVNGGESWDFYDYRDEIYGAQISRLAYTRANGGALLAGTGDGRILVHRRDSLDWELCFGLSKGAINVLVVAQADENYVYAGTSRGVILRSQDGGENWTVLGQPSNEFNVTAIAVAPNDPGQLYVSVYGNGGYTIWKSQDMGQSWNMVPCKGLPRSGIGSLVVIGQESHQLIAGTVDGLFISRDEGSTWKQEPLIAPLASMQKVALSAGRSAPVYVAVGGSIYVNPDGDLETWIHGQGLEAEYVRTIVVDPDDSDVAYAGVLLLGEWSVFITRDGGRTWERTTPPTIKPVVPDTVALALAKARDGRTVIYAGTIGCGVFRSDDGGGSWETFGRERCDQVVAGAMPSDVSLLAVDAENSDMVYAAAAQQVYCSEDGGFVWQQCGPKIDSPITGMTADSANHRTVYLIIGSEGFWRSEDGGETWHRLGERWFRGADLTTIAAMPGQAGHLIIGASTGEVWTTSNGGKTWRFIRENLAIGSITSIATSEDMEGKILIGSLSDGMALFTPGRLFGSTR